MPLRTLLRFRNPDLTSDLNHRLRDLIGKGVFLGGNVIPVAGTLTVQIQSLGAVGADGMVTVLEGGAETVTCTAGITQWIVLRAYYVANDEPVAALEAISQLSYDALSDEEKARRIKLASVTLSVSAVEVTTDDISFVGAERIDPVGRSKFRGNVDTRTSLPDWSDPETGLTNQNQPFDLYFVEDERIFYAWDTDGIDSWQPVISSQELIELNAHKENQDDGTVPPDLYDAQHVLKVHRDALDAGSASVALHVADGTPFGSSNPFMDAAFPTTITSRQDVTGMTAETKVQLSGTFYVGTGGLGTANVQFAAAAYQKNAPLLGTDGRPITIASIRDTTDTAELTPSTDADALGYYTNPYVEFDFTDTADSNYTGDLSVFCGLKRDLGQTLPADHSVETLGLDDVWVPDTLQWTGGTGSPIAQLNQYSGAAQIDSTDHLVCNVATTKSYFWSENASPYLQMSVTSGDVQLQAMTGGIYTAVLSSHSFEWAVGGTTEALLTSDGFRVRTGINCGGTQTPGIGGGIFSNGLVVGFDGVPTSDKIQIGDSSFYLQRLANSSVVTFDTTVGDSQIQYDETGVAFTFSVQGNDRAVLDASSLQVADKLEVGNEFVYLQSNGGLGGVL